MYMEQRERCARSAFLVAASGTTLAESHADWLADFSLRTRWHACNMHASTLAVTLDFATVRAHNFERAGKLISPFQLLQLQLFGTAHFALRAEQAADKVIYVLSW